MRFLLSLLQVAKSYEAANALVGAGVTLDLVAIGDGAENTTAKAIAKASGGFAFAPSTMQVRE